MSKISIIGGGSWGTTLGQVLTDNGHEVLIYDINKDFVEKIKQGIHPFFDIEMTKMAATANLDEALKFSNLILLSVPTKVMRVVLKDIANKLEKPVSFINVSKGIEPDTLLRISEVVNEEIPSQFLLNYAVLTGPSHAEEVILRKLTLLVSASQNESFAKEVQCLFSNEKYIRVYTSTDLIGCEVGGTVKNAIAIISGVLAGYGMGENARSALITRGILEIVRVVTALGGKKETAFGLTGIGDLIVTASSNQSRNFRAGFKIGQGIPVDQVISDSKMVVEGIRSIEAMYNLSQIKQLELPITAVAYEVIFNGLVIEEAISRLLKRELKEESID